MFGFHAVNLGAYQPEVTRKYCQISTAVDVHLSLALHQLRQVYLDILIWRDVRTPSTVHSIKNLTLHGLKMHPFVEVRPMYGPGNSDHNK